MTRTERATHPRALNRDRSEARNGLDPNLRKGGAGNHNWGSLADEERLEISAMNDENQDLEGEELETSLTPDIPPLNPPMEPSDQKATIAQDNSTHTEEEIEKARKFRKHALKKGEVDLAAIARTSAAVSGSPPRT